MNYGVVADKPFAVKMTWGAWKRLSPEVRAEIQARKFETRYGLTSLQFKLTAPDMRFLEERYSFSM